ARVEKLENWNTRAGKIVSVAFQEAQLGLKEESDSTFAEALDVARTGSRSRDEMYSDLLQMATLRTLLGQRDRAILLLKEVAVVATTLTPVERRVTAFCSVADRQWDAGDRDGATRSIKLAAAEAPHIPSRKVGEYEFDQRGDAFAFLSL